MTADEELTERLENGSTDAQASPGDGTRDHLLDIEDGSGCTEIWEQLSERRADAKE